MEIQSEYYITANVIKPPNMAPRICYKVVLENTNNIDHYPIYDPTANYEFDPPNP